MNTSARVSSNGDGGVVSFPLSTSTALIIQIGDITKWCKDSSTDAIVNPANERMLEDGSAEGDQHSGDNGSAEEIIETVVFCPKSLVEVMPDDKGVPTNTQTLKLICARDQHNGDSGSVEETIETVVFCPKSLMEVMPDDKGVPKDTQTLKSVCARAIHMAAGPDLLKACWNLPEVRPGIRCPTGEAWISSGFLLPASHVIHTVGPIYDVDSNPSASLANAYRNSLRIAKENSIKYIAFPAISCGVHGYPYDEAATVAISTIKEFQNDFKEIHFVLFTSHIYDIWIKKSDELLKDRCVPLETSSQN